MRGNLFVLSVVGLLFFSSGEAHSKQRFPGEGKSDAVACKIYCQIKMEVKYSSDGQSNLPGKDFGWEFAGEGPTRRKAWDKIKFACENEKSKLVKAYPDREFRTFLLYTKDGHYWLNALETNDACYNNYLVLTPNSDTGSPLSLNVRPVEIPSHRDIFEGAEMKTQADDSAI